MSDGKLVELDPTLSVFASSAIEARFLHEEIFTEGCYDDIVLPEHPFVVDVGANIGMFLLWVARRHPGAEVLAFEPMPDSVALARRNLELHGVTGVTLHEVALGAEAERDVVFTFYPMIPGNSTRYPEIKEVQKANMARTLAVKVVERMHRGREVTVQVERLSAFLTADRPIDLLKLDVEGAEVDVLLGIDATHWPLVRQVVMEVQDLGGRLAAVRDVLRRNGFEVTVRVAPLIEEDNRAYLVHATRP
ncbi:MAG TPA: FkbM family methyltransferase [Pseudonocardiaceae bacterium]